MRNNWMMQTIRILLSVCLLLSAERSLGAHAAEDPNTKAGKQVIDDAKKATEEAKKAAEEAKKAADEYNKAREAANKYPSDVANYLGDTIRLNRDTKAVMVDPMNDKTADVCIPAGTYLKGGREVDALTKEWAFVPACNYPETFALWGCDAGVKTCDDKPIKGGTLLKIRVQDFDNVPPNRYGVTFGGLIIPFKFQLTGKQDFKATASAAPYMGYRLGYEGFGVELAPVVFAGIGVVSATKTKEKTSETNEGGESTTKTEKETTELASFSYGVGLIGTLKRSFHFGAMLGFDHTGSGKGYKYNDKPWFALELGASFN